MFEPFHPFGRYAMDFLTPLLYMRPDVSNELLSKAAEEVFSGRFTNSRVDGANCSLLHQGLIIKDVFANLFAYWAAQRFPWLKIVLLVRNPFAVALSKRKTRDWSWVKDPLELLSQEALRADYLAPYEDLILKVSREGTFLERQILIWTVVNLVPLQQFRLGDLYVAFYEDVVSDPQGEIARMQDFTKPDASRAMCASGPMI